MIEAHKSMGLQIKVQQVIALLEFSKEVKQENLTCYNLLPQISK